MYEDDIARTRAQIQMFDDASGKEFLLGYVAQTERLCVLIYQALKRVSDNTSRLVDFHVGLVDLKQFLDSARETLSELDTRLSDLRFGRQISYDALMVVRTLSKTLSAELDALFWVLPTRPPLSDTGPRPLDLTGSEILPTAAQPEQ